MKIATRTVRRILLATVLLLLVVILGFISYARYRAHQYLARLPRKLGVDIKQETTGFTYSQSVAGRTIFTVHASREVQRTNGKITLHDVGITLYGRTPGSVDRIHGSDFEYEPASGVLTAQGEVYLDLQAPDGSGSGTIHVKTSGLTFLEKERTANTDQPIEISAAGVTGQAAGASYDSAAGMLILKQNILMKKNRAGHLLTLAAAHAEIDRKANLVHLTRATVSEALKGGEQRMSAQSAEVGITPAGAPTTLDARGDVQLSRNSGAIVSGDALHLDFNQSEGATLRQADLRGNVHFREAAVGYARQGSAGGVRVLFDAAGKPKRADLSSGVEADEIAADSERKLHASTLELRFDSSSGHRSVLRHADASGGFNDPAVLVTADRRRKSEDRIAAQDLKAEFDVVQGAATMRSLDGIGTTELTQRVFGTSGEKVSEEQSRADSLHATFKRGPRGNPVLSTAEQHGHVAIVREVAARAKAPAQTQRARAQDANFDAVADTLRLSGSVFAADPSGELFANAVTINRATSAAEAQGSVRATYRAATGSSAPLHITADRAEADQASGVARFFGAREGQGSPDARMWQGSSQLEAPEIDFNRTAGTVAASGAGADVRAALASPDASGSLTRIRSQELVYTEPSHRIDLSGDVQVEDRQGTVACSRAQIQLAPAAKPGNAKAPGGDELVGSSVRSMEAEGGVKLQQDDRRATGEKLVYTGSNQVYVLTGTSAVPPRLTDAVHGTISGAQLQFHAGDDSVEILSGPGQRVRGQAQLGSNVKGRKQ